MIQNINTWTTRAQDVAHGIRQRVLRHTLKGKGGYLSQACSSAEILATLYTHVMSLGPSQGALLPSNFPLQPNQFNEARKGLAGAAYNGLRNPQYDRFFLSPAHYAVVLYATLVETGRLAPEGFEQCDQDGSIVELIGSEYSPGMESTSGSLGQALSVAGGVALARKRRGEAGRVWVFLSDGELQEGQTWEALTTIGHYQLDNLGIYVDVNGRQSDGPMTGVMKTEPIKAKMEAFGAKVYEVNGHDVNKLAAPVTELHKGQPLIVLAYTDACRGVELLRAYPENQLHYVFLNQADYPAYQALLDTQ